MTSDEKLKSLPDCAVLNSREFADLIGVAPRTVKELEYQGSAPPRVQLSKRRYGFTVASIREWIKQRTVTTQAAA
jgi:predicted DNA-binding transcriptional regulator AlpA